MRTLIIILGICSCFLSCESEKLVVDKMNPRLELRNGTLYYQNLPFTGILISRHTNEGLKMKIIYADGRKNGYEKHWDSNGVFTQSRSYTMGVKTGVHLGWWADGTKKFEYHFNEKGAYHGTRKEWYRSGQLVRDFNYSNGKETGKQRMWSDSGKIRANYEVRNGERFGLIGLKKCYTVNTNSNEVR